MIKELQEKIVNDLLNNFKDITGYKINEVVDFEGEHAFLPDMILITFEKLDMYVAKKYQIDLQQEENLLTELDNKILEKVYN
ncbi:MAG: hypothetical protein ACOCRX_10870 [Candidatus Woesearchaeota archaeon]